LVNTRTGKMLEEYRAHTKERYEMGIPPKPLSAE